MAASSTSEFIVRVVRDPAELPALEAAWADLAARSDDPYLSQTYLWAWCGWHALPDPSNAGLACVTVRRAAPDEGGQLVGIWAFLVRHVGLHRLARPLGSGGFEDYGGPLIEGGPDQKVIATLLWEVVRTLGDRIDIFNLPATGAVTAIIAGRERRKITHRLRALCTDFRSFADWNSFQSQLSRPLRSDLLLKANRLRRRATVEIGRVTEPDDRAATLRWIIENKRRWLAARGLHRSGLCAAWLMTDASVRFLTTLAARTEGPAVDALGSVGVFALKADGRPIAGIVMILQPRLAEYYITTYDPAWSAFSPGKLLTAFCVRWAFDHGCAFDFRMAEAPYKRSWANAERELVSFYIATTPRGWWGVGAMQLRRSVRRAVGRLAARLPGRLTGFLRRVKHAVRPALAERAGVGWSR